VLDTVSNIKKKKEKRKNMFENCSVMIIKANTPTVKVCRLELGDDAKNGICSFFSNATAEMSSGKTKIQFDGRYSPRDDEFFTVENFRLCDEIKDAIRNPSGIPAYTEEKEGFPNIKAVFVGRVEEIEEKEIFVVAFQCFRKEQYLSTSKWLNVFFENEIFVQEKRFGITISNTVDCYFSGSELQFTSYYFARQIFNLGDHYRTATDREIMSFAGSEKLSIDNVDTFQAAVTSWMRRIIAQINDSGVLENYSAEKIKTLAKWEGIDITVENERIALPTDKETLKAVLGFLAEEAYRGPFSRNTYIANSKRKIGD
jgi:hypothetical protein